MRLFSFHDPICHLFLSSLLIIKAYFYDNSFFLGGGAVMVTQTAKVLKLSLMPKKYIYKRERERRKTYSR